MDKEVAITKWGGRRKNAGRKPGPKTQLKHRTAKEKEVEDFVQRLFKTGNALTCPDDLDDDARNEWNKLMVCYAEQNVNLVTTLDVTMLRLFCESYSRYVKAWNAWNSTFGGRVIGDTYEEQKQIDKCMKLMQEETKNMKYIAPDLCLTISGRMKAGLLAVKGEEKKDNDMASQLASFFKEDDEQ